MKILKTIFDCWLYTVGAKYRENNDDNNNKKGVDGRESKPEGTQGAPSGWSTHPSQVYFLKLLWSSSAVFVAWNPSPTLKSSNRWHLTSLSPQAGRWVGLWTLRAHDLSSGQVWDLNIKLFPGRSFFISGSTVPPSVKSRWLKLRWGGRERKRRKDEGTVK